MVVVAPSVRSTSNSIMLNAQTIRQTSKALRYVLGNAFEIPLTFNLIPCRTYAMCSSRKINKVMRISQFRPDVLFVYGVIGVCVYASRI